MTELCADDIEVINLGDATNICRLCFESNNLQPLEESPLLDNFRKLSNLELRLDGKLPKYICEGCTDRLQQFQQLTTFNEHCKRAQEVLQWFFDNATTGKCTVKVEYKNTSQGQVKLKTEVIRGTIPKNNTEDVEDSAMLSHQFTQKLEGDQNDTSTNHEINSDFEVKEEIIHLETEPLYNDELTKVEPDSLPMAVINDRIPEIKRKRNIKKSLSPTESNVIPYKLPPYKCKECGVEVTNMDYHEQYTCTKPSKGYLICKECDFTTNSVNIMYNHALEIHKVGEKQPNTKSKIRRMSRKRSAKEMQTSTKKKTNLIQSSSLLSICDDCGELVDNLELHRETCDEKPSDEPAKHRPKCGVCKEHVDDIHEHKTDSILCRYKFGQTPLSMCDKCGKLVSQLSVHQKSRCASMSCSRCDFIATSRMDMRKHFSLKHSTFSRPCPTCNEIVPDLYMHRLENKQCQYKCDHCSYSTTEKKKLEMHVNRHTKMKKFTCEKCGVTFKYKRNLARHNQMHLTGPKWKCSICSRKFSERCSLRRHMEERHYSPKVFNCQFCHQTFNTFPRLSRHVNREHEDKKQEFDEEPTNSTQTKEKIYQCDYCDRKFSSTGGWRHHIAIHKKESRKCPHCKYTTYSAAAMTNHIRIHTGERPYKCAQCNKAFRQKSYLRVHMLFHQDKKKHVCDICNKTFFLMSDLKRHKISHMNNKFECHFCDKILISPVTLRRHLIRVHGIEKQLVHGLEKKLIVPSNVSTVSA